MKYVYLGKIVNTHGLKGEIRLISDFKYKKDILKVNNKIYIGDNKKEVIITSYRYHKIYDMITLKGYNNIDQVLDFKGMKVYFNRTDLDIKYLDQELIGFDVFDLRLNKVIGKLKSIRKLKNQELLELDNILIPYNKEFVKEIKDNQIIVKTIGGMVNEN